MPLGEKERKKKDKADQRKFETMKEREKGNKRKMITATGKHR